MGADDGGVDHHVFGVGVAGQVIQNTLENSALAPPAEALVGALPADCLAQYRRHGPYAQEENP